MIMCGYFCIGFFNFMFKDKSLKDFTDLFLRHILKKWQTFLSYKQNINSKKPHRCETKHIYLQLGNTVWFTFSRIKQLHDFFIAEINYRQRISEKLNRYITVLYYFDKAFIILPGGDNDFSNFLFTTVIVTSVGIASVSNSLVFPVDNRIVRMFFGLFARMNYILFYTRHSIENISKALILVSY